MDRGRAQPARSGDQLGITCRIGWRIAAQVPAPTANFGARTHQALIEIGKHLFRWGLDDSFFHCFVEHPSGFFYIAVALAGADEAHPVPRAVQAVIRPPAEVAKLPSGGYDFLRDGVEV